jgi:hypothetical protein
MYITLVIKVSVYLALLISEFPPLARIIFCEPVLANISM